MVLFCRFIHYLKDVQRRQKDYILTASMLINFREGGKALEFNLESYGSSLYSLMERFLRQNSLIQLYMARWLIVTLMLVFDSIDRGRPR